MNDPAAELVTVAAAARVLGVSERLLRKRAEQGRLSFATVERDGRRVAVVRLADAAAALSRALSRTTPPAGPRPDPGSKGAGPRPDPGRTAPDPSGSAISVGNRGPTMNSAPAAEGRASRTAGDAPGAVASTEETRPETSAHKPAEPDPATELLRARVRELEAELARAVERARDAEAAERATNRYADRVEARMAAKERDALTLARALGTAEGKVAQLTATRAPAARRSWFGRLFGR